MFTRGNGRKQSELSQPWSLSSDGAGPGNGAIGNIAEIELLQLFVPVSLFNKPIDREGNHFLQKSAGLDFLKRVYLESSNPMLERYSVSVIVRIYLCSIALFWLLGSDKC